MTWVEVSDESTDFVYPSDLPDGYVLIGYIGNGYLLPEGIWSPVDDVSTSWAAA